MTTTTGQSELLKIAIGDIQRALEGHRRSSEADKITQPEAPGKPKGFSLYGTIAFAVQRVKKTAKSSLGPSKPESSPEDLASTFGAPGLFPDPLFSIFDLPSVRLAEASIFA